MRSSMSRFVQTALRSRASSSPSSISHRSFSSESSHPESKVAVLGAAGGIGQPLALFIYDITDTPGVPADVSHINTRSEVAWYMAGRI